MVGRMEDITSSRAAVAGRFRQLDGLRGFAVLAVLVSHTMPAVRPVLNPGVFGVRLFFVLSGFLITGILLRARAQVTAGQESARHVFFAFYVRRFLRIFPLYYAVLLGAALLDLPHVRETFFWNLTYLSNYFIAARGEWPGQPVNHLWSLAVEEQFYLAWPAVVLFTPRRWLLPLLLTVIALGPLCRVVLIVLTRNYIPTQLVTFSCMDSLGTGALLAFLYQAGSRAEQARRWLGRLSLAVGLFLYVGLRTLILNGRGFTVQTILEYSAHTMISAWLVDRAVDGFGVVGGAILEFRPLVYLGGISYGVYVFHDFVPPLTDWLEQRLHLGLALPADGLARFFVVSGLTCMLAALSWHAFEKPLNDLKDRFRYVRGGHASPAAADTAAIDNEPDARRLVNEFDPVRGI